MAAAETAAAAMDDEEQLRAALQQATADRVHDLLTEVWRENARLKARLAADAQLARKSSRVRGTGSDVATPRSTWDAPSRPGSPAGGGARGDADAAVAERIAELEAANAALESRAQSAERRAKSAQDAYHTMWSQTAAPQRLELLNRVVCPPTVPKEFQGLSGPELLPRVLQEYEVQRGIILQLKHAKRTEAERARALAAEAETLREDLDLACEQVRDTEAQFGDRLRQVDELHAAQEWLLQQNAELHAMLGDANRGREALQRAAKAKDRQSAEDRARLDDARAQVADQERGMRELSGQVRELSAERDVLLRQLESANRRADALERRLNEVAERDLEGGTNVKAVTAFSRRWGGIAAAAVGARRHGASPNLGATHSSVASKSTAGGGGGGRHSGAALGRSASAVSPVAHSAPSFPHGGSALFDASKSSTTMPAAGELPPPMPRAHHDAANSPDATREASASTMADRPRSGSGANAASTPSVADPRSQSEMQDADSRSVSADHSAAPPMPAAATAVSTHARRGASVSPPAVRQTSPQPRGAAPGHRAAPRPFTEKLFRRGPDPRMGDRDLLKNRLMTAAERHRKKELDDAKEHLKPRRVIAPPKSLKDLAKPPPRPSHP